MKSILGKVRSAVQQYDMIHENDRVAVGVSGGKDSVALLCLLAKLKSFYPIPFTVTAITLDPGFEQKRTDYTPIAQLCQRLEVPYHVVQTDIAQIVFDIRRESNPCSLCAKMRRGALHDAAKAHDCNVIALGHHFDDAVETFFMNLLQGGRIACFSPVTYLSRKDITLIRPLVFAEEREVSRYCNREQLPLVKSKCPIDGATLRQSTKEWIRELDKQFPAVKQKVMGAMQKADVDGWGVEKKL